MTWLKEIAILGVFVVGAALMMGGLIDENAALSEQKGALQADNIQMALDLKTIKIAHEDELKVLGQEKHAMQLLIDEERQHRSKVAAINESLTSEVRRLEKENESFKRWGDQPHPASVVGLFNSANQASDSNSESASDEGGSTAIGSGSEVRGTDSVSR